MCLGAIRLTPRKHEVSLIVDPLLPINGIWCRLLADPVLRFAPASEMEIHLLADDRNGLKIAH